MREVVAVTSLSRSFGSRKALNDVTLAVSPGSVFGLVGENGAGKSTLIKHLLGLWRAETGSVKVFGLDPVSEPPAVLGRIGYLSEQPDLPGWMRVAELLRYTQAFYPRWDTKYANKLLEQFSLDVDARIKTLSKGQRARLGLIAAEAHRPELLILDEPSSPFAAVLLGGLMVFYLAALWTLERLGPLRVVVVGAVAVIVFGIGLVHIQPC